MRKKKKSQQKSSCSRLLQEILEKGYDRVWVQIRIQLLCEGSEGIPYLRAL